MPEAAAAPPVPETVETAVDSACQRHGDQPALLIEILHDLQGALGLVPEAAPALIARRLNLSRAEVHGVISFYHDFRTQPAGRLTVRVCRAEACQSQGAAALIEDLCRRHGIALGETSAGGVTVQPVYCLGLCAVAPAAMVGGHPHGRLDGARLDGLIAEAAQ